MIIAAITAAAGLLGVLVGASIAQGREDKRWLRDAKLEGVRQFISTSSLVYDRLSRVGDADLPIDARLELRNRVQSGRTVINLLCSEPTVDLAEQLATLVNNTQPALPESNRKIVYETLRALTAAVRTELSLEDSWFRQAK